MQHMVENYLNTRNRYSMFRLNQLICLKRLLFPTMLIMLPSKLYSAISFSTIGTKWEVQNTSYQKKKIHNDWMLWIDCLFSHYFL